MIKSLKKIMNSFSAQYAGEHLSTANKINILNNHHVNVTTDSALNNVNVIKTTASKHEKKHIALLCNDSTDQGVLDYILGHSSDCEVDILYHGIPNTKKSKSFYKKARSSFIENNIDIHLVKLINNSISEIKDYVSQQRSLQYLVTDSHNHLINDFLSNKMLKEQFNIPLVLIN